MTLTRYQLVFIILIVVIAAGVGITVWYVEHIFKEREDFIEKVKKGDPEDLVEKPPQLPQTGPPPVKRSTSREHAVLVVVKRPSTPVALIRGNGEFVRLPSLPDEPGPVVTGVLDRARVDDLLRSVLDAPSAPAENGPLVVIASTFNPGISKRLSLDQTSARSFLEFVGKEMNRKAVPESVGLQTAPADPGPAIPWPFERATPESFQNYADLKPGADKAAFREGLLKLLQKDARFSFKDKVWKVVGIQLVPLP